MSNRLSIFVSNVSTTLQNGTKEILEDGTAFYQHKFTNPVGITKTGKPEYYMRVATKGSNVWTATSAKNLRTIVSTPSTRLLSKGILPVVFIYDLSKGGSQYATNNALYPMSEVWRNDPIGPPLGDLITPGVNMWHHVLDDTQFAGWLRSLND